jgi:hypothetical protein
MLLNRFFADGMLKLGGRKLGLIEEVRLVDGAADNVKLGLPVSGWLCCEGSGGSVSFFVPFRGEGRSDKEGITGNIVEFRYSFPKGLSRACTCFKP